MRGSAPVSAEVGLVGDPTTPQGRRVRATVDVGHNGDPAAALGVLRRALDAMPGGFAVLRAVRRDGHIVDWVVVEANDVVRERYEEAGDIAGRPVALLEPYAPDTTLMRQYAEALRTGEPKRVEAPLQTPTGSSWRSITIVPVGEDLVASFSRDSTAEHELDAARARFAGILDNTSAMVMILDADGDPVCPRQGSRFLGWDDHELTDRSVVFVTEADEERLEAWFEEVLRSADGGATPLVLPLRTKDGGVRICKLTASNRLADPDIGGVIVSVEDATTLVHAEVRAEALAENVTDIVVILDSVGRLTWVSPALKRVLGDDPALHVGRDALDVVHPDDRDAVTEQLARALEDDTYVGTVELRITDAEKNWRWFECRGVNRLLDPVLQGLVVSLHDISERRMAEAALRDSEARCRAVLETAADAIITVDQAGRIEGFNRAAEEIFQVGADDMIGRHASVLLARDDGAGPAEQPDWTAPTRTVQEVTARRSNGELFPAQMSVSVANAGDHTLVTAILRDVTDQKRIERRLERLALHDELTGLPNRRLLVDRIEAAMARARRHKRPIGVMFLDLDRFKVVNDSLGHDTGDQLLVMVAERLAEVVRESDTVSRLGGDEFVVLCEDLVDRNDVSELALRVVDSLTEPFVVGHDELFVSASVGVAAWDDENVSALDLLRFADTAMYRAKEHGRARVEQFDATMQSWIDARIELEAALRHALARNQLRCFYQPIVTLADGVVTHAEALLRWQRPDGTMVSPADIVRIAEDNGLIVPIGEWVLRQAAADCASWQDRHPGVGVSVNVSPRQLSTDDLRRSVSDTLATSGLDPALLTLEITESVLLENTDRTLELLEGLHRLGIRIALDDFGTGFSSLTYLRQLPIDELKIDHSFVEAAENGRRDVTMLRTIVDLGHAYHLDVVAEGVDTDRKAATLRTIGCPYAQGFLYGRPSPLGPEGPAW